MKMRIILIGLYIACELIANVTASKPVQLGGMVVPAAIFIYTLTFTLIDLINESLGKEGARQCEGYFKNVDWSRSKAYALGLGGVFINQAGRDAMRGS